MLKRKQQGSVTKSVGFVKAIDVDVDSAERDGRLDSSYEPFLMEGFISFTGEFTDQVQVKMLRDTGTTQSFVVAGVLPFSEQTSCGSDVLVQGIEVGLVKVPLHQVHFQPMLCTGSVKVGVRECLPVKGVEFILGNDLAGGKVFPMLEVSDNPVFLDQPNDLSKMYPEVFPSCAVTQAQAHKKDDFDLSSSFIAPIFTDDVLLQVEGKAVDKSSPISLNCLKVPLTFEGASNKKIISAQTVDLTLRKCFSAVVSVEEAKKRKSAYFVENGLLMRRWCPDVKDDSEWDVVYQVVIPSCYRHHILSLAHDHDLSGHLGITKTYNRILRHFFLASSKN